MRRFERKWRDWWMITKLQTRYNPQTTGLYANNYSVLCAWEGQKCVCIKKKKKKAYEHIRSLSWTFRSGGDDTKLLFPSTFPVTLHASFSRKLPSLSTDRWPPQVILKSNNQEEQHLLSNKDSVPLHTDRNWRARLWWLIKGFDSLQ